MVTVRNAVDVAEENGTKFWISQAAKESETYERGCPSSYRVQRPNLSVAGDPSSGSRHSETNL